MTTIIIDNEAEESPEVETFECDVCGERHEQDDSIIVLLDDCCSIGHATERCADHHGYTRPDNMTRAEQRTGAEYVNPDYVAYTADGDNSATSEYARDNWYYSESADGYVTEYENSQEYEEENRDEGEIFDSDADVIDVHGWPSVTPRAALCFGVELETEATDSHSALAEALGGREGMDGKYICKSDGSLDNGIEIVTGPYTLEYHQARFGWDKLTKRIGGRATSFDTGTCGIHIHINRAALSPLTLGKLLVFINTPDNVRMVEGIAQRSNSHWCKFHAKKVTDSRESNGDKYQSLNVRGETVEMRIFKGNLNPKRILKNIEFAHAAVMYCAQAGMQDLTWQAFWRWLRRPENGKTYANLIEFAHGLLRDGTNTDTTKDV